MRSSPRDAAVVVLISIGGSRNINNSMKADTTERIGDTFTR